MLLWQNLHQNEALSMYFVVISTSLVTPHTCIILVQVPSPLSFFLRRYGWLNFIQIYVFHNYSQLQSWISPNLYGVSPTMWSSQSTWKKLHFSVSSVTIDRKIWTPKLELILLQSSVAPKPTRTEYDSPTASRSINALREPSPRWSC